MFGADVDWGPVSSWVAAILTFLAVTLALLVAFGVFDSLKAPKIRLTFQQKEPWCRTTKLAVGSDAFWVRVGVENVGRKPARGCIGRVISVTTDGEVRQDVDPIQLRWAGVPRAAAFRPLDIRRGQREFLNVLFLRARARWQIVTYTEGDFDPGFSTELKADQEHILELAIFSDNADTATRSIVANFRILEDIVTVRWT